MFWSVRLWNPGPKDNYYFCIGPNHDCYLLLFISRFQWFILLRLEFLYLVLIRMVLNRFSFS